jgi:competence protein ComFC
MNQTFDRILSLLFPKRCVLCGSIVAYDDLICAACKPNRFTGELCGLCGRRPDSCVCDKTRPWFFKRAVCALQYCEVSKEALLTLKKTPDPRAVKFFAAEMAAALHNRLPGAVFDFVAEVPMHREKYALRGFNHAELLAAELSGILMIPHIKNLLECSGGAIVQHVLNRDERFAAADNGYKLASPFVNGKTALMVDDIITTGATFNACARQIINGGAAAVYALSAAGTNKAPRL